MFKYVILSAIAKKKKTNVIVHCIGVQTAANENPPKSGLYLDWCSAASVFIFSLIVTDASLPCGWQRAVRIQQSAPTGLITQGDIELPGFNRFTSASDSG